MRALALAGKGEEDVLRAQDIVGANTRNNVRYSYRQRDVFVIR